MMLKPSYTKFCRSWLPHSKVISHIPMCIPILEKSPSASFQCYHNHTEVQCTKQMEWLVLVSRVPVGRILMAILLCDLESLLYTVSMVCVMDLKSYRSESPQHQFRIFKSRFLQAAELIIYDNLLPEQGTAVFPAHEI